MATDLPLIDVHTHAMPLPLLRRLVAEVGCDRVLVGTDAPFGLADRRPRETVAELELDRPRSGRSWAARWPGCCRLGVPT